VVDLITTAGGGTTGIDGLFTTVGVAAGGDATLGAGGDATLGSGGDATLGAGGDATLGAGGDATLGAGGDATLGAGGDATLGAGGDATLGAGGATGFGATGLGATLLKIRNNFREEESFVVVALTLTSTKGNEVFTSADSNEALTSFSLSYNP
jgi:hypothetical protein